MRKFIVGLAATGAVLASTVAAPSAHASGHQAVSKGGCVTRAEYKKVKKGWHKARVDRKFGTRGHKLAGATSGGFSTSVWNYKTCSQFSAVAISYDKRGAGPWKLSGKSAVWVS